ncbi:MAG: Ribosomal protein [Candidatus Taylorbacteria bacterium]|nr:Ribosomal protein [Candidatus Taylorbacteria bacterium]
MAMKSNKSYLKRLKVTKNGKILGRATGQNHFNSKESRRSQLKKKNAKVPFHMTNKEKSRFLVNA